MRQTGRTTRIINFAVGQLLSVGEVIVTDHTSFEYPGEVGKKQLEFFIERVKETIQNQSHEKRLIKHNIIKVGEISMVHFKLESKVKIELDTE